MDDGKEDHDPEEFLGGLPGSGVQLIAGPRRQGHQPHEIGFQAASNNTTGSIL